MPKPLEGFTEEQIAQMAEAYHSLISNPETRMPTLQSVKKVKPNVHIPELELRAELDRRDAAIQERIDKEVQERIARETETRIRDARTTLRDRGYSSEDVAAIEKIMTDKAIASYDVAAEFFDQQRKLAEPTPNMGSDTRGGSFTMPTSPLEAMKNGRNGLRDWARGEGNAAIDDLRSGRVRLH